MLLVPIVLAIIAITLIIYQRLQWMKHFSQYRDFYEKTPTPFYVPIIGNSYLLMGKNILPVLEETFKKFGNSVYGYIPHRTYFTCEVEEIKIIINHFLEKSKEYDHLRGAFGNSLVVANVNLWKKNRKILSKGFKQGILDSFVPTFYSTSNVLKEILKNKEYSNIFYLMEKYTLDVFCEATFGVQTNILTLKQHYFVTAITTVQKMLFDRIGNIIKMNDYLFSLMPCGKQAQKYIDQMDQFLQQVIDKKKAKLLSENVISSEGLPVLDLMLHVAEKEKFDDQTISKEMVLFAAAATDTTAYSMAYAFLCLALNPHVQEKVYEEIISVAGKDGDITANDLVQLKYTEMALNESMRLLPVIPLIARQAVSDIDLGHKVIPKDTGIIISFFAMHRKEEHYPNPLVYDPDRFLPENIAKRHPYSFLPFSGGPRNCIGWKYAQMVMKTTIANVIRSFKVTTKHKSLSELSLESSVVMTTLQPLDLTFTAREE